MNVLLTDIPEEWNGFKVNTSFRIGIQIHQAYYDKSLTDYERSYIITDLMFGEVVTDENGDPVTDDYGVVTRLRDHPSGEDFSECVIWFLQGWNHDKSKKSEKNTHTVDYDVDQWRIYADFRQIYRININEVDMHWWEFQALLWNMPPKQSSFLQVISYRTKDLDKVGKEQRRAYEELKDTYGLEQPNKKYTSEEERKIDEFDRMMKEQKIKEDIAKDFESH